MPNVLKADGSLEPFNEQKVRNSIKRAGVSPELEDHVLTQIKTKIYDNIPTYDIYGMILDSLSHSNEPFSKARYSLKQSIMLLGPTGYPFEDFVADVLTAHGYTTHVRQLLKGKCVTHEVDVVAQEGNKHIMIEAKFHNNSGTRSEVQVALYVKARFDDVKDKYQLDEGWLVTNTKATTDATMYADCVGMKVISWNFPEGNSLRDLIEQKNLHPITMLTSLSSHQKAHLLANHVIMCKDIVARPQLLDTLGLSQEERKQTLSELNYICHNTSTHQE